MSDVLLSSPPGLAPLASAPSRWRKALRLLAAALILAGALALIDAGIALLWQEPISALYAKLRQDRLSGALHRVERAPPTPSERRTLSSLAQARARISYLARKLERHAAEGSGVGRIHIPSIDASFVVVKGTSTSDLQSGPGIYPETGFPGIAGTTAIAGHRTTYLAPFRHIDALHAGEQIMLDMPYAHFTYSVLGSEVVPPSDVRAAVADVGYNRLVLSACTPLFSAAKRLLVFAHLTRTVPVGAARLPGHPAIQPIQAPAAGRRSATAGAGTVRAVHLPAVLEPLQTALVSPLV
jgi:sortase A